MSDVKWIKLVVGLFDDEKILLIESMPNADSIIIIWIKLLCLAGKPKIREADVELEIEVNKEQDINVDVDVEADTEADVKNTASNSLDYNSIIKSFTSTCKSLPKVVKISANRKMAIDAAVTALEGISFEQFFTKVENSDFLTSNAKKWCDFDWILQSQNLAKILSGKYDDRKPRATANFTDHSRYENINMEVE